ncbi:hypothetical protein H0E87_001791 [Populus deltoides]|uniref:EF-hand domain-containing protein n=1 Tax=Populus deltoides TaxID=3696 RepID=A0A8T2ZSE1_POPDE|nr:hypothetical protein H0E87_001791 [Populus deltoides]
MGVVIIDGSTIRDFVNDEAQFNKSVDEAFTKLDLNNDGVLSRSELRKAFETLRLIETHFGVDYRSELKKIMLAIADGLGSSPIQMALEDDDQGFIKQAADLEASKLPQQPSSAGP